MAVYDATTRRTRLLLESDRQSAFQNRRGCLVARYHGARNRRREENLMLNNKLAIGSGARYANISADDTTAVYDGQRKASDSKRVFILSRSAFAGAQRNAVTHGPAMFSPILKPTSGKSRRAEFLAIRHTLLDDGYRRILIGTQRSGLSRVIRAVVPIRRLLPHIPGAWHRTTNQNELWSYGPEPRKS